MKYDDDEVLEDMIAFAKRDFGMRDLFDRTYAYFVLCGNPVSRTAEEVLNKRLSAQAHQQKLAYLESERRRIELINTRYGL